MGLDLDQYVGEPPAGDARPGEFVSNDQSAPVTTGDSDGPSSDQRSEDET